MERKKEGKQERWKEKSKKNKKEMFHVLAISMRETTFVVISSPVFFLMFPTTIKYPLAFSTTCRGNLIANRTPSPKDVKASFVEERVINPQQLIIRNFFGRITLPFIIECSVMHALREGHEFILVNLLQHLNQVSRWCLLLIKSFNYLLYRITITSSRMLLVLCIKWMMRMRTSIADTARNVPDKLGNIVGVLVFFGMVF